jgi:hypothetical protein
VARGASGVLGGARLAGESQVGPEVSEIDRRAERRDRAAREIARPSASFLGPRLKAPPLHLDKILATLDQFLAHASPPRATFAQNH